jgi:hypothetical protein
MTSFRTVEFPAELAILDGQAGGKLETLAKALEQRRDLSFEIHGGTAGGGATRARGTCGSSSLSLCTSGTRALPPRTPPDSRVGFGRGE